MIRINLLPHREARRKQQRQDFFALLVLAAIAGVLIVIVVGGILSSRISTQNERNEVIKTENLALDGKIREIAALKEEIEALKARQQAVEDLQGDRNQPVYLMDALVKQTPAGIYLRAFKQEGQRVVLNGYAQSNERVAELLRNLNTNSAWLERPELISIRLAPLTAQKSTRNVFDFTVSVNIKRARESVAAAAGAGAAKPAVNIQTGAGNGPAKP